MKPQEINDIFDYLINNCGVELDQRDKNNVLKKFCKSECGFTVQDVMEYADMVFDSKINISIALQVIEELDRLHEDRFLTSEEQCKKLGTVLKIILGV